MQQTKMNNLKTIIHFLGQMKEFMQFLEKNKKRRQALTRRLFWQGQ